MESSRSIDLELSPAVSGEAPLRLRDSLGDFDVFAERRSSGSSGGGGGGGGGGGSDSRGGSLRASHGSTRLLRLRQTHLEGLLRQCDAEVQKAARIGKRLLRENELLREQVVPVAALNRGWMLGMTRLRKTFQKLVSLTDDPRRARRIAKDGLEGVARDIQRAIEDQKKSARLSGANGLKHSLFLIGFRIIRQGPGHFKAKSYLRKFWRDHFELRGE